MAPLIGRSETKERNPMQIIVLGSFIFASAIQYVSGSIMAGSINIEVDGRSETWLV
jgi:hypothetical protein